MASSAIAVSAEDERLHVPSNDPLWSESFYLNFGDSQGMLGGFTRVALHPGRGGTEGLLCLYMPGGGVGITLQTGALAQSGATLVRAGALVHECVSPLRQWRISYRGPVSVFRDPEDIPRALEKYTRPAETQNVELVLDIFALHEPYFYSAYRTVKEGPPHSAKPPMPIGRKLKRALRRPGEILSALNMRKGRHYEQSMSVRGSVTIEGQPFDFEGSGHRDHSWGPRDWAPSERWRWLTGQLGDFAFNAMYLTIAGTHVINGYVWHDGRCDPIDTLSLDTTFDGSGLAGREIRIRLTAAGRQHDIVGDVMMNVPLPITGPGFSTMYNIGRTRYRSGTRTGYGVAEFLERLDP